MAVVVHRNKIGVGSKEEPVMDASVTNFSVDPDLPVSGGNAGVDLAAEKELGLSSGNFRYLEGICTDLAAKFT